MQYLRFRFPIPESATRLHLKVLVNGSSYSENYSKNFWNFSGVLLVSAVIISAEFCSLENGLLSNWTTRFEGGCGHLIRGGCEHLIRRSTSLLGVYIRCPHPHDPTYVVYEVSRRAENPAHSTLLRASLRKAALSYDDELSYAARPQLILFSKLAGTHRQATARRVVSHQPAIQLMEGRN